MKKTLLIFPFLTLFLSVPLVQAHTITVPTTAHFGFGTGVYINFSTQQTFDSIYKENDYWYFNKTVPIGFQIQNANMTINNFFAGDSLVYTVSGASTSKINVSAYGKGEPLSVFGASGWSYTEDGILTITTAEAGKVRVRWTGILPTLPIIIATATAGVAVMVYRWLRKRRRGRK